MLQHNRPKPNFHLVLRNLFANRRRSRLCPPRRWPRLRANPHGGTAWSVRPRIFASVKPTNFHGVLRFFNSLAFRIERNANSRVFETQLAGVAHPRPVIADFAEFRFGVWLWMASAPDALHRNRLSRETSAYLLQHQPNPVHWWPWGPELLAEAN